MTMLRRLGIAAAFAVSAFATTLAYAAPLKVAVLIPGHANDGSFNQVAREAAEKLAKDGEITLELREEMADPSKSEPVIRQYASLGYDLIIGHGIELSEPILKIAKDFPKVHFAASGGPDLAGRLLANVDGWTYDFGQQGYLGGFIAGKIAGVDTFGMVGGPQLAFVKASHKGFKEGLKEGNPKAKTIEIYTGSFDDAQKAAEVTRGLIEQGAKIVWTSGDGIGNGVAAAAAQGSALTIGVTGEAGGYAKRVNIASVVLDMYPTFKTYVDDIKAGSFGKKFLVSGIANKGLILTPINADGAELPPDLAKEVDALIADLASGKVKLPNFFE
jgi:basic membrane lipoprotein Med (substrate-binding protein (PBP1-ABC) superfamily)